MAGVPRCAVVIPTYNGAHLLSTCLEVLLEDAPVRCSREIVVIDDASQDDTLDVLARYGDAVTAVAREVNGGFAKVCNQGAEAAGDVDYLVFLNNDTLPVPGWLDALVDEAAATGAAGVGAQLLYPNGTVQHAGVVIGQDRWPHHLYAGFPAEHPAVTRARDFAACTAACLLVRRGVFEEMRGFDPAFHNGYEDIDLCLRMRRAGHRIRYCPKSVVYHLESVTRWPTGKPESTAHNDRLFDERWRATVTPDDLGYYVEDGLLTVEYDAHYPVRVSASAELAAVTYSAGIDDVDAVLSRRARQVMDLLSGEIRAGIAAGKKDSTAPARDRARRPELLRQGGVSRLGAGGRRISVLMPVRNGGPLLKEVLAALHRQQVDAEIEIIAVDSSSTDGSVETLGEADATIVRIDHRDFEHGLTRNLAAGHARGEVLVFLNQQSLPVDDSWLRTLLAAVDTAPDVAGACSRVLPHASADVLTRRDGHRELSGAATLDVRRIGSWPAYQELSPDARRAFLNFHTVAAAVRADVFARHPFRAVRTIGEDLLWARDVVEAGYAIVHQPASRVYHSHDYSLRERFMRNVDDGVANRDIVGRRLPEAAVLPLITAMVDDDWRYLREHGMQGGELQSWQIESVLRRTAQAVGQCLGANHDAFPPAVIKAFSRVAAARGHG